MEIEAQGSIRMTPKSLTVEVVYSAGPMPDHGILHSGLRFVLRLIGLVGGPSAGTVGEIEHGFRHFRMQDADFRELCRLVGELAWAERPARVTAKADTSDGWARLLLHVSHESGGRTLALDLQSSGFEGEDAALLHRFFAILLGSAGLRDGSARASLTGGG